MIYDVGRYCGVDRLIYLLVNSFDTINCYAIGAAPLKFMLNLCHGLDRSEKWFYALPLGN